MKSLSKYKERIKNKAYDACYYTSDVEIIGNHKVIIENCKHIVECNDIMVKVKTAQYYIIIWGSRLTVSDFNKENVIINGIISSVEIEQKGKSDK